MKTPLLHSGDSRHFKFCFHILTVLGIVLVFAIIAALRNHAQEQSIGGCVAGKCTKSKIQPYIASDSATEYVPGFSSGQQSDYFRLLDKVKYTLPQIQYDTKRTWLNHKCLPKQFKCDGKAHKCGNSWKAFEEFKNTYGDVIEIAGPEQNTENNKDDFETLINQLQDPNDNGHYIINFKMVPDHGFQFERFKRNDLVIFRLYQSCLGLFDLDYWTGGQLSQCFPGEKKWIQSMDAARTSYGAHTDIESTNIAHLWEVLKALGGVVRITTTLSGGDLSSIEKMIEIYGKPIMRDMKPTDEKYFGFRICNFETLADKVAGMAKKTDGGWKEGDPALYFTVIKLKSDKLKQHLIR